MQSLLTSNIYHRVGKLDVGGGRFGTAFVVGSSDRVFLVTARHVIEGADPFVPFEHNARGIPVECKPIAGVHPEADVAVLEAPHLSALNATSVDFSSDGVVYSQDLFFLGYPYGLALQDRDFVLPFVKKATLSATVTRNGVSLHYLDGINNPGFSGGPVCAPSVHGKNPSIIGVISGYHCDLQAVRDPSGKASQQGSVATNSGIILAYDIESAMAVMK